MYVKMERIRKNVVMALPVTFLEFRWMHWGKQRKCIYIPDRCQKEAFGNTNPENFCYRIPSVMKVLIGITRVSCLGLFNVRPEVPEGLLFYSGAENGGFLNFVTSLVPLVIS